MSKDFLPKLQNRFIYLGTSFATHHYPHTSFWSRLFGDELHCILKGSYVLSENILHLFAYSSLLLFVITLSPLPQILPGSVSFHHSLHFVLVPNKGSPFAMT